MRALLAIVALAGCADWPSLDPDDRDVPLDDRLGTEVFRTDHGLRIASTFQDARLQIAFEVIADGWQMREIDPDTLAITELPPPPLSADASLLLGRALAPTQAVIVDDAGDVHVLADDVWTTIAAPIAATTRGALIAHHGRVYAELDDRVFVWDGDAWSEPVTGGSITLGGFDADTQWLLASDTGISAIPVDASGVAGVAVPGPAGTSVVGAAINGDASGFQLLTLDGLQRFDGSAFFAGSSTIADAIASAPGSARVVVRAGDAYTFADDAVLGAQALAPFTASIDCACDVETDDDCACVPHDVGYVEKEVSPHADMLSITMADAIDGYGVLTVRFLGLPYDGDPFRE